MRSWLWLAALTACGHDPAHPNDAAADGATTDAAPLEAIHYVGRFDAQHRAAWPGSAVHTRFTGTDLMVELADTGTNWFEVTVDGVALAPLVTHAGDRAYPIATGLAAGDHDLVLAKRTESFQGTVTFAGFPGATLVPTPRPAHLVEFIGDSITCGYGDLGVGPSCEFSPDTESEPAAWGALAEQALGVPHVSIAYSGIGMVRDVAGTTMNVMPVKYLRTFADDASSTWDFSYTPDVIVIALGTNDFAGGDPGEAFVSAYVGFVTMLEARFPAVKILVATSPMNGDPKLVGYLQEVAAQTDVTVVELAVQQAADGYGCDYHPSAVTHTRMAATIVPAIRAVTGW
jgi:lysophospholipase L1-like esterase